MVICLCVHSPANILNWVYSCYANRFSISLVTISPDWGRPYMFFFISMYTLPFCVVLSQILYSCMILSVMSYSFSLIYS